MTEPEPIGLDDAYALESPEDSRRLYARWADTYDSGFVQPLDYRYPERVAAVFVDVAGELGGPILDALGGSGTIEALELREIPIYGPDSPRADDLAMIAVFRRGRTDAALST